MRNGNNTATDNFKFTINFVKIKSERKYSLMGVNGILGLSYFLWTVIFCNCGATTTMINVPESGFDVRDLFHEIHAFRNSITSHSSSGGKDLNSIVYQTCVYILDNLTTSMHHYCFSRHRHHSGVFLF